MGLAMDNDGEKINVAEEIKQRAVLGVDFVCPQEYGLHQHYAAAHQQGTRFQTVVRCSFYKRQKE